MKTLFVFLTLIVAVLSNTIVHKKMVALNKTGSFSMKNKWATYSFYEDPKTFKAAEQHCKKQHNGGHLVSIHSQKMNAALLDMVRELAFNEQEVWIGGKRNILSHNFHWTDGTKWDFTYWRSGSPSNSWVSFSCVAMHTEGSGYWHDIKCSHNRPYICKSESH
ncbi:lectin-like isoform X2 [Protopterus annectens]|uniref:lectin-like isoform X2 n=1 Tax=Protopterus annectens TaxID=7888 RepID=UPI001CFC0F72|nr:lectin-like isoform X2 [Protopterus annectens]